MKTIIVGLPYFVKDLTKRLRDFDSANTYIGLDTNASKIDKLKYLYHIISADVVYSIGGHVQPGGAFKTAYLLKKKILLHWVGTDVLKAKKQCEENTNDLTFSNYCKHVCDAPWLADELKEINIQANTLSLVSIDATANEVITLPNEFSILSYIGEGREDFYGMPYLIKLANDFPQVNISIVGISNYSAHIPSNIKLLGWVKNMPEQYKNHTIFLRLPEHDGMGYSVIEALSLGRYVGLSNPFPHTSYIKQYEDLKMMVSELREKFLHGSLEPNVAGKNFVYTEFEKSNIMNNIVTSLKAQMQTN